MSFVGFGVGMGKDHTLFALQEGHVWFRKVKKGENLITEVAIRDYMKTPPVPLPAP